MKRQPRFRALWMQNYLQTYLDRDLPRLFPALDRQKFRLFVQMLAQLSGSIVNYSEVARALGVSQPTARDYFHIAHGSFLWRHLPAYERNATKRVVKHPKGYLRDFVAERGCRYGIVINNDEAPRLLDENLIGLPFAAL